VHFLTLAVQPYTTIVIPHRTDCVSSNRRSSIKIILFLLYSSQGASVSLFIIFYDDVSHGDSVLSSTRVMVCIFALIYAHCKLHIIRIAIERKREHYRPSPFSRHKSHSWLQVSRLPGAAYVQYYVTIYYIFIFTRIMRRLL